MGHESAKVSLFLVLAQRNNRSKLFIQAIFVLIVMFGIRYRGGRTTI